LTQELGRSPSVFEVAQRLGASEEETLQALESGEAMNLLSLDMRLDQGRGTPDSSTLLDLVGRQDVALNDFEAFGTCATPSAVWRRASVWSFRSAFSTS
jgi:RNA polymerase sigma-B factor